MLLPLQNDSCNPRRQFLTAEKTFANQYMYLFPYSSNKLVVKTAIKLLLVFIEYNESNYLILLGNLLYTHSLCALFASVFVFACIFVFVHIFVFVFIKYHESSYLILPSKLLYTHVLWACICNCVCICMYICVCMYICICVHEVQRVKLPDPLR